MKRLTAEQLADAIDFATGTREKYAGLPLGTRAIQLPDSEVKIPQCPPLQLVTPLVSRSSQCASMA